LRRCHGHRPFLEQEIFEPDTDLAQEAVCALVQSLDAADFEGAPDLEMILQVFADAFEFVRDFYAMLAKQR